MSYSEADKLQGDLIRWYAQFKIRAKHDLLQTFKEAFVDSNNATVSRPKETFKEKNGDSTIDSSMSEDTVKQLLILGESDTSRGARTNETDNSIENVISELKWLRATVTNMKLKIVELHENIKNLSISLNGTAEKCNSNV